MVGASQSLSRFIGSPARDCPRSGSSGRDNAAAYYRSVVRYPEGFDVEGPVQAEIFVVWLADDHLELTGPCGPALWLLELGPTDHPVELTPGSCAT